MEVNMKNRGSLVLSLCLITLLLSGAAFAWQEGPTLSLGLIRNFGYGGLGKIQGNFTLRVVDPPDDLTEVSFYLNGELMEVVTEAPFQTKFRTSDYPDGENIMSAEGVRKDGAVLYSNTVTKVFLSSDQAWSETQNIIVPLLIGVGLLTLIGIGAPALLGRKKEFVPGSYGPAGGAVCPRCALPFARSFLAPNLMVGKLVRCPHCGKFSILARASSSRLQEAERRYAGEGEEQSIAESADDIKKMIDDSRFES
jgi:hypothetical protein